MQYFNNKKQGLIIDVGAADGFTGSNSFRLINEMNWKILQELNLKSMKESFNFSVITM
jgi:hypothetical protein